MQDAATPRPSSTPGRALVVCLVGLLAVACCFRAAITSGFTRLLGDTWDGRIETAILEHWYNVFRGLERWNEVRYFYPARDSLGYNDGYFLYGAMFSVFRALGADIFLASELVNVVLHLIGFYAAYGFARRAAGQEVGWALLGAVLFTVASALYIQSGHAQLLSIGFAPLVGLLAWECGGALREGRGTRAALAGSGAALLYGTWLLTAFYMAWFTTFFAVLMVIAWLADQLIRRRRPISPPSPVPWPSVFWPLPIIALVLAASLVPFLLVYLPKVHETGGHGWEAVLTPSVLDLVHLGVGNYLFGWADRAMTAAIRPGFTDISEHTIGLPPVLFVLSLIGVVLAFRKWRTRWQPVGFWRAVALGFVLSLVLVVHFGPFTLWTMVYRFVPGASAIRAITRYVVFLAWPASLLATETLAAIRGATTQRGVATATGVLAVLLVAEEFTAASPAGLDRPSERRFLAEVAPPPASCRSFFIMDGTGPTQGRLLRTLRDNVDAMVIAETTGLPTLNADSSFHPADNDLLLVREPDYLMKVARYANAHDILDGLCAFDLPAMQWKTRPFPPFAVMPGQTVPFGTKGGEAAPRFIGFGWSGPERDGWWTEGSRTQMLLRVVAPDPHATAFVLHVATHSVVSPTAPPPRVEVLANGHRVAEWHPGIETADWQAVLPAGTVPPDGTLDLRFHMHDPREPILIGTGNDTRNLGMYVISIRLDTAPAGKR